MSTVLLLFCRHDVALVYVLRLEASHIYMFVGTLVFGLVVECTKKTLNLKNHSRKNQSIIATEGTESDPVHS